MTSKKRQSSSAAEKKDSACKKQKTAKVAEDAPREDIATRSAASDDESECGFVGEPIPAAEAKQRWPRRYKTMDKGRGAGVEKAKSVDDSDELMLAKKHFSQAKVDAVTYNLNDDAYVQGEEGKPNYICKIIEMFEGVDKICYFRAQWFYRAPDTLIEDCFKVREEKRVFLSDVEDDNPLDCLVRKLHIIKVRANVDVATKMSSISDCDYYYDMLYSLPYCTFMNAPSDDNGVSSGDQSTISSDLDCEVGSGANVKSNGNDISRSNEKQSSEMRLLDLYAGCGAMSTGLCLGAKAYGVNLTTRWAIDLNEYACESLKLNHPETEVRNESVEDFLALLKEWEKLCMHFSLVPGNGTHEALKDLQNVEEEEDEVDDDNENEAADGDAEVFEVEKILAICYGDPKGIAKQGLYLKVRWKGYGSDDDTWEPIDGLSDCPARIKEFVTKGFSEKILPLPGDADAICGGPPCQGISGFNRFRDNEKPLEGDKNKQMKVYMDVVDYLKPRYVLMENVVDLVKFSGGFLGRYALGRLVDMNYQTRMGMMAAGSYGLPQFRMRVFMWGARPTENLPQYALPTHDVVNRGVVPVAFDKIVVGFEEGQAVDLKEKLFLRDAISDLPAVANDESRDEMPYGIAPQTAFQRFIRLKKDASYTAETDDSSEYTPLLLDHRPLRLNQDDYARVCHVPKRKGANFRDLEGVRVVGNKVQWDPDVPRVLLPSGKQLIPDYAMSFINGTSSKPFGRLWWDETVPTVVGRAEPHNQIITHPEQDRVLTIRENARLQGFPDYYKLCGPIKQRYIQVGNAVAVPVARALGYGLAKASQGDVDTEPLFKLPPDFPKVQGPAPSPSTSEQS